MSIGPNATKGKGERGQTTAEFVAVFPFIILLFFLIVDFGWLLKNWIVVTNTAREAARCIVTVDCVEGTTPVTPSKLAIDRMKAGLTTNVGNVAFNAYFIDQDGDDKASAGDTVFVCLKAENQFITPVLAFIGASSGALPSNGRMNLSAAEAMRLEFGPLPAGWNVTKSTDGACHFS